MVSVSAVSDAEIIALIKEARTQDRSVELKSALLEKMPTDPVTEEAFPKAPSELKQDSAVDSTLLSLYGTYKEYRLKGNPRSPWFEKRLAERVDDYRRVIVAARADAPVPPVCPPATQPTPSQDFKGLIQAAEKSTNAEAWRKVNYDEWKTNWGRARSLEFLAYLEKEKAYIPEAELGIVSREQSKLAPAKSPEKMSKFRTVREIIIHHSDTAQDAAIRDIQNYHFSRGWNDIGYHWLVSKDSQDQAWKVFAGRDFRFTGAHVENQNKDKWGIEVSGNYHPASDRNSGGATSESELVPPPEALHRLASQIMVLADQSSNFATQLRKNDVSLDIQIVRGHGDCKATDCPGDGLLPTVRYLNYTLQKRRGDEKAAEKAKQELLELVASRRIRIAEGIVQ